MAETPSFPPRPSTAVGGLLLVVTVLAAGYVRSAGSGRTASAEAAPGSPDEPTDATAGVAARMQTSVPVCELRALAAHENVTYVRTTREPNA